MSFRSEMRYMNPYDIHKRLINDYLLRKPGDTKLLKRDTSKDRTAYDVLKQNHRFIWSDDSHGSTNSWEVQFARRYYDKLFKEYCIGDLSRYKENKIALRWRTEPEVISGRGQFTCGNKKCDDGDNRNLRSWEVNFAYVEDGEKKNALVKIRLCSGCSKKLNYHSKKREVKRLKKRRSKNKRSPESSEAVNDPAEQEQSDSAASSSAEDAPSHSKHKMSAPVPESPWDNLKPVETKSRDEEMEEYLQDLLL